MKRSGQVQWQVMDIPEAIKLWNRTLLLCLLLSSISWSRSLETKPNLLCRAENNSLASKIVSMFHFTFLRLSECILRKRLCQVNFWSLLLMLPTHLLLLLLYSSHFIIHHKPCATCTILFLIALAFAIDGVLRGDMDNYVEGWRVSDIKL